MLSDRRAFLGAVAAATLAPQLAWAQDAPLRIVVPFTAGSGTDVAARVLGDALSKNSGRPVIVDNKPGAGSVLGSLDVARARPDGNTVLFTTGGYTTNAILIKKLPFDPIADFTPITRLAHSVGFALLVSQKSPYKTLEQFVAAAKAQPGKLSFGSSGVGNTTHVMGVFFCLGAGIELLHVPFKGTPITDLLAGTVDSAFLAPSTAGQQIRAGQLRALGISGSVRSALLPDVPTFAEQGLKVEEIPAWSGIFGPAKMPPDMVRSLYDTIARAGRSPAVKAFMRDNGDEPELLPPEPFKAYVASEIERYRKLLPPLNIQMG
ncbi:Bug family tripartite tricarboxylate transporter substrate binding protein [Variovorax paradoxus]|uniref:Bug family tripartite tricarboxylate transporter substrate binding protein n=1 Tax=Variovorax paradoxus TaxID=34073 RepID=UPI0029C745F3|nr:tripartite tricarboxylate transporter substrate binding protein [Variovorax paradoxus]